MKGNKKYILSVLKGFLLFVIPPLIVSLVTIIMNGFYSFDILKSALTDTIKFGLLGILLSLIYLLVKKYLYKYSKIIFWTILIAYYAYFLAFLISLIYARLTGPLLG